jgi:AraC family transcriptional regulator, transcriptional activator of pobA
MHSNALPVMVERHLPLLPMGLVSPAFCWASVDDDLNYIFHIASGRGTVTTQSGVMRFSAPCAVIVPAGEAHNFQFDLNASGMALTISAGYLENLLVREKDFTILFAAPVIVPLVSEQLTWPLARLAHELSGSDVARTAAADSHLLSILVQCVRALEHSRAIQSAHPKAAATLVTRLRELIEQHYRDNMSLAQYAATLGVTQTRLREACLMVTGMLPNQLIQQRILLEAQRALLNSTMTIAQTAYYLGFNDPAYFSRFFTKAMGQSPRMYREKPKSN